MSTQQITQTLGDDCDVVLGTLPHALTLTLGHSLTHSLNHYYYCGYCFYYGDFCRYCYYYRDYAWLKRMWWRGGGMAATADATRRAGARGDQVLPVINLQISALGYAHTVSRLASLRSRRPGAQSDARASRGSGAWGLRAIQFSSNLIV